MEKKCKDLKKRKLGQKSDCCRTVDGKKVFGIIHKIREFEKNCKSLLIKKSQKI